MSPDFSNLKIVPFSEEYASAFASLNQRWIEQFFVIEPADEEVLTEPFKNIVAPGGEIFFILKNGVACGTCAVIRHNSSLYELAKMAVAPEVQGHGLGNLLIQQAINFARQSGADKLMLLTHSSLGAALHLYEKHGFLRVPVSHGQHYSRAEVEMELEL